MVIELEAKERLRWVEGLSERRRCGPNALRVPATTEAAPVTGLEGKATAIMPKIIIKTRDKIRLGEMRKKIEK